MSKEKKKKTEEETVCEPEIVSEDYSQETAPEAGQSVENEYLLLAKRVQADFDNYRRRNAAAAALAREEAAADTAASFLPLLDNFERALAHEQAENTLYQGLQLMQKQLLEIFAKLGVSEIAALGEAFNPEIHHAVLQVEPENGQASGIVAEVLEKGYRLGERVLRYPLVKVTI